MAKRGKRYQDAAKLIDTEKPYSPSEAIALAKKCASAKFDETVEVAFKLGVDPRHADQQVRGTVILPHGTGRDVRVLVRYDIENLSDETYRKALGIVFSEPPVDILFEEQFEKLADDIWKEVTS